MNRERAIYINGIFTGLIIFLGAMAIGLIIASMVSS
jgi:hypothetical protein